MDDLISRQEAIYAVNTALFPKINTAKDAEKALRNLPPEQPETCEDTISRQAAISVIAKWMLEYGGEGEERERNALRQAAEEIKYLSSAQPDLDEVYAHAETEAEARYHDEIVRCRECRFYKSDGCFFSTAETEKDGFCSWAERRTDE